eukprot:PITA_18929
MPFHLSPGEKRRIVHNSTSYSWINEELYKIGPYLIVRRCVREDEIPEILKACHNEPCGGHFSDRRTAYKILLLGYYWPSIFRDTKEYVKRCDSCQRMGKPTLLNEILLQPQVLIEPFEKWALDFVGPISPPSKQKEYILRNCNRSRDTVHIQTSAEACEPIQDKTSEVTPYHPQANGKIESTNKVIEAILTKIVHLHRKDWVEKLLEVLWAYKTTWRNTIGHTPYELVYGKQILLPIEF